ncbi:MAG: tandem-95 repeat protein [Calditrichaeota bacterium]|nr:MAG: tandem-95 repeat protein [Calditrichota bacterium]MBL1205914.1 tandem-95 repeat protein [Calditrichota bacterium]NOG45742.1 tandem-95 repeat protein [Calditrichota bacterium]
MRILLLSLSFLINPLFSQSIEKTYFYQNEPIGLKLKTDQLNVIFKNAVNDSRARNILSAVLGNSFENIESLNQKNKRLIKLSERFPESELSSLINRLNVSSDISIAGPVFIKNSVRSLVSNQFVVRFDANINEPQIERINIENDATIIRKIADQTYLLATIESAKMNGLVAANIYMELTETVWAHPNFGYLNDEILDAVNDPYYSQQWAHINTGQAVANHAPDGFPQTVKGFNDADMDVDLAWEILKNNGINPGQNILVGIMDSGVELTHPDLQANIVDPGKDFTASQQNDGNDVEGHGTNVAGIIAAVADNGEGVAGIAYSSGLLPVKMNSATDAEIASSFDYAWQFGCDVLSNSWSGTNPVSVVTEAINRAKTQGRGGKGCVIVFSTGNEGHGTVSYPANLSDVIAVGAANMFNEKSSQGSRDGNYAIGSNYGSELDLVAPTLVYTTNLKDGSGYASGAYNDAFNGTSGACPHVSATAALILSADGSLTSDQVQDILQQSAEPIERYMYDSKGWNKQVGYGRVNAHNAVQMAIGDDGDVPDFSFNRISSSAETGKRTIEVSISDNSGIAKANLFFRTNYRGTVSSWTEIGPDSELGGLYTFNIPGQQWETQVEYYFYAEDASANANKSTFPTLGDLENAPPLTFSYHVAELQINSYTSTDVPKNWDNVFEMVFTSTLDIADDFLIVDADATVSVDGQIQDFAIIVEAPSNVASAILSQNTGTEYQSTHTDDEASTPITDGKSPYNGSFQPDNGLFVFDGEQSKGQWLLRGWDSFWFNNGGSLTSWKLDLTQMKTNDVPVVSGISNQTIDEGNSFTLIQLNSFVSDGNHSDAEMTWSSSGNSNLSVFIDNQKNTATVQTPNNDWYGSETITFTATDPGAASGGQAVVFTVNNINDAPVVSDILNQTIEEGAAFATISLDDYVSDIDNADSEISWSTSTPKELSVSIDANRVATISAPNADWYGSEQITFTATDPGELSDNDAATFTVNSVNDAPVMTGIPDQTIDEGGSFATISLNNYVSDVDNADSELSWEYSGNSELSVSIDNFNTATITIPDNEWSGSETITFKASDPGELFDSDPAIFIVNAVNDAPVVSDIPNQTVLEGASFTTISLDDFVTDIDNLDSEINWTYSGTSDLLVSINASRVATISAPDENWNGSESITFTATDPGLLSDNYTADFTITAVNDAPVVSDIPDQTISEGSTFTTIPLDNYVMDVDDADADISWVYSGNNQLTVTINASRVATITIPNINWSGSETILFKATDTGALADSNSAIFVVNAVNDAPVVEGIPNQSIAEGETFATISLDNYVSDVDNADADLSWGYTGNTDLTVSIDANRIATITTPGSQWNGSETITFTATDPGNSSDSDAAVFSVGAENDPPVVSAIPDQTIAEGENFITISLDDYVTDPDNTDAEMSWEYSGNTDLQVSINGSRVATIIPPNSDWNGSETITFQATDPGSLADSDNALFKITAVNDAPVVTNIPDQTIAEGEQFDTISLDEFVSDVDNSDSEMIWSYSGNNELQVEIDQNRIATITTPNENWNGSETITFAAKDPGNLGDNNSATFNVSLVNNAPVVSNIPAQTIEEGQSFNSIPLDNYVDDSDHLDSEIIWTATGNSELVVSIDSNRVATINLPNENWNGSETITFTAKDPANLSDSDEAVFTVNPQNDAPKIISDLPQLISNEDVSLEQMFSNWYPYVSDPDNTDEQLTYLVTGNNEPVSVQSNKDSYLFSASQNWFGQDTFLLKISDGQLADSAHFVVKFNSINDAPEIINFPDSLIFENTETYVFDLESREKDIDSPINKLHWQISVSDSNIVPDYSKEEKVLVLTAEGFVGEAQLFATLLDDSNAVDLDTLTIKVTDKILSLDENSVIPVEYSLKQNYPNPFNPSTTIQYNLPKQSQVQLIIFDVSGKKVATLVNMVQQAGSFSINFESSSLASGLYFYFLKAIPTAGSQGSVNEFIHSRKMLLIK